MAVAGSLRYSFYEPRCCYGWARYAMPAGSLALATFFMFVSARSRNASSESGFQIYQILLTTLALLAYCAGDAVMNKVSTAWGAGVFGLGHLIYFIPFAFPGTWSKQPGMLGDSLALRALHIVLFTIGALLIFTCVPLAGLALAGLSQATLTVFGAVAYGLVLGLAYIRADFTTLYAWLRPSALGYMAFALSDLAVFYQYFSSTSNEGTNIFITLTYVLALILISTEELARNLLRDAFVDRRRVQYTLVVSKGQHTGDQNV
jgi:hypothetical protein